MNRPVEPTAQQEHPAIAGATNGSGGDDERPAFLEDVWAGLQRPQKMLPSKYLYDERGATLFDQICELEEYYVTRAEMAIMREHTAEMARKLGPGCLLLEYGSGTSTKTYCLLEHLTPPALYAPVDIAREHLQAAAERIAADFPSVDVVPICADFTGDFDLPRPEWTPQRRVVFFPGSTIGNFTPEQAVDLLSRIGRLCGPGGGLLIGVDLRKAVEVVEPAYNDRLGVTAAFNLNILTRINRELGGDFDLTMFRHRASWDEGHGRIEMHLESLIDQVVRVAGRSFAFTRGETILTEYSHKYTVDGFASLAQSAGFRVGAVWTDARQWFSVHYLEVPDAATE